MHVQWVVIDENLYVEHIAVGNHPMTDYSSNVQKMLDPYSKSLEHEIKKLKERLAATERERNRWKDVANNERWELVNRLDAIKAVGNDLWNELENLRGYWEHLPASALVDEYIKKWEELNVNSETTKQ